MDQLHQLRTLHLFAGSGGGILGDILLEHRPVCAVEIDAYCQQALAARQSDALPWFPVWDDVTTFDGHPWRGLVDIVCGGFPCQDISAAGKGRGLEGEKSGLWREMARIIGEVGPRYVFVENSPQLTGRGLDRVLVDLAAMGYDAVWGVLGADDAGAPHIRKRIWILAYTKFRGFETNRKCFSMAKEAGPQKESGDKSPFSSSNSFSDVDNAMRRRCGDSESEVCPRRIGALTSSRSTPWDDGELITGADGTTRFIKPGLSPLAYGVARRVDKLRATGNGQVPIVAATAFRLLISILHNGTTS